MLCANVKVSAEIYKKNNAKPPAGIRYTHPRGCVFSFGFKTYNYRKSRLLTLKEGGKNSHRRGFAAPPPSVREASCNHSRKQNHILRQCYKIRLQKASLRYACLLSITRASRVSLRPRPQFVACDLRRKSECGAPLCCDCAAERKHAVSRRRVRGLSLKITTFSFISLKENV